MDPLMQDYGLNSQDDINTLKNEAETWNILLQIVLPLVLVLTFVAVYQILTYREAYKNLKDVLSDIDPPPSYVFQKNILDIQFQKLLVAFGEVKHEEIERLKLFIFSDTSLIKRNRMHLQDEKFKNFCDESKEIFEDVINRQRYLDSLYSRILEKAQVEDSPDFVNVESCQKIDSVIEEGDTASARPNRISLQNRCKIHQRIIDFAADLEKKINTIQIDLVCVLFAEITPDTQGLPASTKHLAVQLLNEKSEDRRRQYATLFHKDVNCWVKNQLSNSGYHFLNSSWRKIESI